jgi:predicted AlkP superfamily phosphohydrolase/phosphomutase
MLWRTFDPKHPNYDPSLAKFAGEYRWFYQQMDQILGEVMARSDANTTIIVLSDHGFAPFYRSFNLNTWLLQNGYIALKPGAKQEQGEYFENVDWSRTRAYGLGLNGLYVNMQGREREGIVPPAEADTLIAEITKKLLAVKDPQTGLPAITRVDAASQVYEGPYSRTGPDMLVGYNRGYRGGWQSILGSFPKDILENNTNAWSGDHCMDYTLVPGVLLSNRKIADDAPALTDIAPTILGEFQIAKQKDMIGQSIFQSLRASRQ